MAIKLEARLTFRGETALKTLNRIDRQVKKVEKSFSKLGSSIDSFEKQAKKASSSGTQVVNNLSRLQKIAVGAGKAFRTFGQYGRSAFSGMLGGAQSLVNSLFSIQGLLASAGAGYLAIYKPLQLASENEQAMISFETLLGSAEAAQAFIEDMYEFAARTPFNIAGVRDSAKMLLAMGSEADEVLPRMEAIGDAVSAVGGNTETFRNIARAFGQIETKGKISAEEMNQLAENGIGAWNILSEEIGLSVAELMKLGEEGKLLADDVLPLLYRGIERKFGGAMERQSKTLAGMWERIKETFNYRILAQWGEGIAAEIRPRLDKLTRWLDANEDKIVKWGEVLRRTAAQATDWLATKFERAFKYINDHYIENPEFRDLSFSGKVQWVINDIFDAFNRWYGDDGKDSIENMTKSLIDYIASGIENNIGRITKVAIKLGKSIGSGILEGFEGFAKENPLLASLMTFVLFPGSAKVKLGAAAVVGAQGATDMAVEKVQKSTFTQRTLDMLDRLGRHISYDRIEDVFTFGASRVFGNTSERSHAGGLSYVPYNGYVARLHKGERVLTAEENRQYTRNNGSLGGGITVNGDIIIQGSGYTEQDAREILRHIVRMTRQAAANGA